MTPEQERLIQAMLAEQEQQQAPPQEGRTGRNLAAAGELALGALPFTRLGRAMLSTIPRALGTGVGAGTAIEGARGNLLPSAEAAEDPVKALQQQMRDAGYYRGPIDGRMGPATQEAKRAFDAAQQVTGQQDVERRRAEAEAKRAEAEAAGATARTQETERLRLEGDRRAAEREAGGQRLRELDDSTLSKVLNAAMTVGPYAGLGLGAGLGHRLQSALAGRAGDAARTAAANADAVMAQRVASNDIPGRVGRVNRFWSEGSPGRAEPFSLTAPRTGGRPPYAPNLDAPPAGDLYRPSGAARAAEALPVPAFGALEHVSSELGVSGPARAELKAAQEAVAADPSEANIQRLQIARARAAAGELLSRLGWGIAGGGAGDSLLRSMGGTARARPASVATAERERGRLVQLLSQPPKPRAPRKKKSDP